MYVRMFVCKCVCMYVCMYVCMCRWWWQRRYCNYVDNQDYVNNYHYRPTIHPSILHLILYIHPTIYLSFYNTHYHSSDLGSLLHWIITAIMRRDSLLRWFSLVWFIVPVIIIVVIKRKQLMWCANSSQPSLVRHKLLDRRCSLICHPCYNDGNDNNNSDDDGYHVYNSDDDNHSSDTDGKRTLPVNTAR